MTEFVLYSYFRSSASYRVRCALHLKGLKFDYKAVHLLNNGGEQHQAAYRDINPGREVPSLIHNGRVIGQSMAILEYLDDVAAGPRLFPNDPYQKSLVRQFCENINCVQPLQNLRTVQFLTGDLGLPETLKQRWLDEWLGRSFETLETLLQKHSGTHCFGDQVGAADCFLVPQIFAAKRMNVDLSRYTNVLRVAQAAEALPAFQAAHPSRQPDTPAST
ncbi:MAG: maleylacetoacetate isomerase [Bdellovibrionaceae bacterium]|nr:maleylacetoacetate isomerase [Pseudobdellovibrionaceae bacterium]